MHKLKSPTGSQMRFNKFETPKKATLNSSKSVSNYSKSPKHQFQKYYRRTSLHPLKFYSFACYLAKKIAGFSMTSKYLF